MKSFVALAIAALASSANAAYFFTTYYPDANCARAPLSVNFDWESYTVNTDLCPNNFTDSTNTCAQLDGVPGIYVSEHCFNTINDSPDFSGLTTDYPITMPWPSALQTYVFINGFTGQCNSAIFSLAIRNLAGNCIPMPGDSGKFVKVSCAINGAAPDVYECTNSSCNSCTPIYNGTAEESTCTTVDFGAGPFGLNATCSMIEPDYAFYPNYFFDVYRSINQTTVPPECSGYTNYFACEDCVTNGNCYDLTDIINPGNNATTTRTTTPTSVPNSGEKTIASSLAGLAGLIAWMFA